MKFAYKSLVVLFVFFLSSCEFFDLDKRDSPNAVTPDNAGVDFLYNNIQLSFNTFVRQAEGFGGALSRMNTFGGELYQSAFGPPAFNGIWSTAYAGLLPDMSAMEALASAGGLDFHVANSHVMRAYVFMTLADMFGSAPLDEANKGTDFISPNHNTGAELYTEAMTLLDAALAIYEDANFTAAAPNIDIYYDGNSDNWIALANTLKIKMLMNLRLIDNTAISQILNIVANENIINTGSEDFEYKYGTSRSNPNNRNPDYNNMYEVGDGAYMSVWYMYSLLQEYKADVNWNLTGATLSNGGTSRDQDDPRVRFYFYRKDGDLSDEDDTVWDCQITDQPGDATPAQLAHFTAVDPNMPYCYARVDGYFGRSHGNGEGIPPDGPIRTAFGLYPAGGKFDDNSFDNTQNQGIDGALGEGITPIWLSSWTWFLIAEAHLIDGNNGLAQAALNAGLQESFDKVESFLGLIDVNEVVGVDPQGNDVTLEDAFLADWDTDVSDYISDVETVFAASADKMEVLMEEFFIAAWGNGTETYNALRRTSRPARVQPMLEVNPGTFYWSALYPAQHVDRNANIDQKERTDKVWWDNTAQDAVK